MRRTILALMLAGCAIPAMAQTPPPGGPRPGGMLMRADANGDGVVTRAEATAAADARFDRLDANRDGTVTRDEARAGREAMRGGQDGRPPPPPPADGTRPDGPPPGAGPMGGTMTRDQSRARALEMFDRADANHDGRVDAGEMAQLRDMRGPRRDGGTPPPPPQD